MLKAKRNNNRQERELDFEGLEARVMLAATIDGSGNLTVDGTAGNDQISVASTGGNTFVLANAAVLATNNAAATVANFGGSGLTLAVFNQALNDLNVNGLGGADDIGLGVVAPSTPVLGGTVVPTVATGEVNINLGEGVANRLTVRNTQIGTVGEQEALRAFGGSGTDIVDIRNTQMNEDLNIRTGDGNDGVVVFNVLVRNDAEIFTEGGNDTALGGVGLFIGNLGIGTGEFTDDNLDVDMGSGNDVTRRIGPIVANPLVAGATLNRVSFQGGAGTDVMVGNSNVIAATNIDIDGYETLLP